MSEEAFLIPKKGRGRPHAPIDKSQLSIGEPFRLVDHAYRKSAQDRRCAVPGCQGGGVVLAHIRTGHEAGVGQKPSDDASDFLCYGHHMQQEANPGPEWWIEFVYKPMRRAAYRAWCLAQNRRSHS